MSEDENKNVAQNNESHRVKLCRLFHCLSQSAMQVGHVLYSNIEF